MYVYVVFKNLIPLLFTTCFALFEDEPINAIIINLVGILGKMGDKHYLIV